MEKSDTFCILPWIHAATYNDGSALLCCVAKASGLNLNTSNWTKIWNSNHFTEARLAMIAGRKFPACQACYKEEANGIRSHRQNENHYWYQQLGAPYLDGLVESTNKNGTVDHDLITLDLRLGNTCNLQCVMCRPQDSSKWIKDAQTLSETLETDARYDWKYKIENYASEQFEWYKNEEFWEDFFTHAKDIKHIIFGGGEPLYIKEHKTLIKRLVESGLSKNIELRYHTNCTIYNPEIVELWEHFEKVELMLSIDGYDWVNSYIRHPADWETIEKNFKAYCELPDNIRVKVLCTVQALNINWLPELADWMMSLGAEKIERDNKGGIFFLGILHWPQYLCSKALLPDMKEKVTKKLNDYMDKHPGNKFIGRFAGIVSFMNSEDASHMYPQMLDYVNGLDKLHGTTHAKLLDI
jgi:MoaA/NifB/PqqE/SkfB family radical SAM enzyme